MNHQVNQQHLNTYVTATQITVTVTLYKTIQYIQFYVSRYLCLCVLVSMYLCIQYVSVHTHIYVSTFITLLIYIFFVCFIPPHTPCTCSFCTTVVGTDAQAPALFAFTPSALVEALRHLEGCFSLVVSFPDFTTTTQPRCYFFSAPLPFSLPFPRSRLFC